MDYESLGMRIRRARKAAGMTQADLAEKLGISTSFLGHIERGTRKASLDTLVKMANELGVSLDSLAVGERSMVAKMNYVKGNFATTHQHPHEQCGYVISGEYRLKAELPDKQIDVLLHAGDSYAIPGGTPHSFEVMEGGEVIDVFTPQREDYL